MNMTNNVLNWLIEDENPAIKYRTLIELNDKNPADYQDCYNKIWEQKQIKKLLSKQDSNGLWGMKDIRDISSIQILMTFAEYGLSKDKRIDRYAEFIISKMNKWKHNDIDVFTCYAPISLRSLVMLGYHDRSDVAELISAFAATQIHDGGFMCKRMLDRKPKRKSCYKAAADALLLYAECKRNNILPGNSENLVNYFLRREVFYSTDKTKTFIDMHGVPKGFGPMKIGIPLFVASLLILGQGNNPILKKTWAMMEERKNEHGRFRAEGAASQPGTFGKDGHENKWSTFYALLAEKYRYAK